MVSCKKCGASIVFIKTKRKNKWMPVDVETVTKEELKNLEKVYFNKFTHRSHFDTCPYSDVFRKKKKTFEQLSLFDLI